MNYFGVEKRVKVVDKVTPRDMERSKMFTQVPPVIMKKYRVTCQIGGHSNILCIIKDLLGIKVLHYNCVDILSLFDIYIEANSKQVKDIEYILGVIGVKEIVNE